MKRSISILGALALCLALSAPATGATKPNIEDPLGDANGINDQGEGDGSFGDFVLPASPITVGDLLEVTFTNDAKNVTVHIQTANPPPGSGWGYAFRVRVNPDGTGGTYCLYFEGFYTGASNNLTAPEGHLRDACTGEIVEAIVQPSILGPISITVPRKAHEAFGKGKKLTAPQAAAFMYHGSSYPAGVIGPAIDTTKPGTDYAIKK